MDGEVGPEFVKPKERKYNRRSSFFQRSISSYNSDSPTNSCSSEPLPENQDNDIQIQEDKKREYLNSLKKEKNYWKFHCSRKLKEAEELRTKHPQAASSADFLKPEDKMFLEDRPDYVSIGRLVDNVTEAIMIKQRKIDSTMNKIRYFIEDFDEITNERAKDVITFFMEEFSEFSDEAEKTR